MRDDDDDTEDELSTDVDLDREWRERAAAVIPGGASTGSKGVAALYGDDADGPTHFVRASGCELLTPGGQSLIDCGMALGSVALGYGDERVTRAVATAAAEGNVSGLSSALEVEVAERLCDHIPCAEQVRFLKSGAEAVAAAVRIARTHTGRTRVLGCGYFGWLDWSSAADGVPPAVRADYTAIPFDDVEALQAAVDQAGDALAAIVLEPVVEKLPSEAWMRRARSLCDATGAVLIFDEIKTGFRLALGGWQQYSDAEIEPDLATFGKAMANGFPLAAVVGRAAVMEAATRTWISSTLASDGAALAAAVAVLDWHDEAEICESLWSTGKQMRESVEAAVQASGIRGVRVEGIDPMWFLRFDEARVETRFLARARDHGVLFKRGPYNYASVAHDDDALLAIERAASSAFVEMMEEGEAT
jgi:glutamate-1-semialdehyde 2,1-aminomutase